MTLLQATIPGRESSTPTYLIPVKWSSLHRAPPQSTHLWIGALCIIQQGPVGKAITRQDGEPLRASIQHALRRQCEILHRWARGQGKPITPTSES